MSVNDNSAENIERENLIKLRGSLAYKSQCQPYIIFPDSAIPELLKVRPKSVSILSGMKGFPANGDRVTKWGKAICDFFAGKVDISRMNSFK